MRKPRVLWGCALAAALLLTSCGKNNAGSSGSGSMSGAASGSSSASQTTAAWKTGLGVITEASEEDREHRVGGGGGAAGWRRENFRREAG